MVANTAKRWYAVYTKPRWEKKVYRLLVEKGVESYCPLNKVQRKWSDRTKIIEEPLFKSYVFVKVSDEERQNIRMVNGIVNFVYWLGKPAIIKDREIDTIKLFLKDYNDISVGHIDLRSKDKIRIKSGIFMDHEGEVLEVKSNYVTVIIDGLGVFLKARLNKDALESRRSGRKKT